MVPVSAALPQNLRRIFDATLLHNVFEGSNVESVEVTKEAVMGMSGPTFYYAQVIQLYEIFLWNIL